MSCQSRFGCLCCGSLTLEESPPGSYDICPVCFWEDDPVQGEDQDSSSGANAVSLRVAQRNYEDFGASEARFLCDVRPQRLHEVPQGIDGAGCGC